MKKMLIFPLLIILLSGCWDSRELGDLAITVALGLDKQGDEFKVTVQVVNPAVISTTSGNNSAIKPVTIFEETGETLSEALRKILNTSPNTIYLSHVRVIVIGEELAKDRLKFVLDFISRYHEFRTDFFMIVAKDDTADTMLKVFTSLERVPANKLYESLEKSEELYAPTKAVTLDDLKIDLLNKGKQPVLTGITLDGDKERAASEENVKNLEKNTKLTYENLAAFKKDRLVGWLSEEESKGYNFITNNVVKTNGVVPCPDGGNVGMRLLNTKTKLTSQFKANSPVINVSIKGEGNIDEIACALDFSKPENVKEFQKNWNELLKSFCEAALQKAQHDFKSDIFGFGHVIHQQHPKKWSDLKERWDDEFENLEVTVTTDFKIRQLGTTTDSIVNELE